MKHSNVFQILKLTMALIALSAVVALAGTTTSETRNPGTFTEIDLSGAYKVILVSGTSCSVKLEGEAEDLKAIKTEVSGNELEVSVKNNTKLTSSVQITITYVNLESIDCSGTVSLDAKDPIKAENFEIDLSGTGRADMEINASNLSLDISGTGNVTLKGNVKKADVDISGAGKLTASEMATENYQIEISGVGNAEIKVSKNLDAEISGTGNVRYHGDPVVKQSVSGTGKVVKM
jgi:hypothetical protein